MAFSRITLPYSSGALTPVYSAATVNGLYNGAHQGFVDQANNALGDLATARTNNNYTGIGGWQVNLSQGASGATLYNAFWDCMGPSGPANPSGTLLTQINADFGSVAKMKDQLNAAANAVGGDGFAFVAWSRSGQQLVTVTTPKVAEIGQWGAEPIIVINLYNDAWSPNYSTRSAYITAWWGVVDWNRVQAAFNNAK